ncbi:pantoate--beta-alanine ligase [Bdellovibrionota bacterium FG-1]
MTPTIIKSPVEMRAWRRALAPELRVGMFPTMGALHRGHAELLHRLRENCDRLVLSVFVNPTQFAPHEDLDRYPRTFDLDLRLAAACGVDAIFFPDTQTMYPLGFSTYVEETSLTQGLCGPFRPGHFRGVTTVVLKLFNLVEPHLAYFGLKDAQQFFVLRKMVLDLNLPLSIEALPTVREPDGLALSSRNRYLSPDERTRAPALYATLQTAAASIIQGQGIEPTLTQARTTLEQQGFKVQYIECVSVPDLHPLGPPPRAENQAAMIAVAAYLGSTRLIDNILIS